MLYGDDGRVSFIAPALNGTVWRDLNADGIQNNAEPGRQNATVRLFNTVDGIIGNGNDLLAGSVLTDSDGNYNFANLTLGIYYLEFVLPAGLQFSLQNQGSDDALDSDPNPTTGRTGPFHLVSGQTETTRDAGLTDGVALSIGDVTVTEGDAGTKQAVFTVTLSQARTQTVTVEFATSDGPPSRVRITPPPRLGC